MHLSLPPPPSFPSRASAHASQAILHIFPRLSHPRACIHIPCRGTPGHLRPGVQAASLKSVQVPRPPKICHRQFAHHPPRARRYLYWAGRSLRRSRASRRVYTYLRRGIRCARPWRVSALHRSISRRALRACVRFGLPHCHSGNIQKSDPMPSLDIPEGKRAAGAQYI